MTASDDIRRETFESIAHDSDPIGLAARAQSDHWSMGFVLACGLGCEPDYGRALEELSLCEGSVGRFYSLVRDSSYLVDREVMAEIVRITGDQSEPGSESFMRYMDRMTVAGDNLFIRYLNMAAATDVLYRAADTELYIQALKRFLNDDPGNRCPYEMKTILFHMAWSYVYGYRDSLDHSAEEFVGQWNSLNDLLESYSDTIRRRSTSERFITDNDPGHWNVGILNIFDARVRNIKVELYDSIRPFFICMDILCCRLPEAIDTGVLVGHEYVCEDMSKEEFLEQLELMAEFGDVSAMYAIAVHREDDPEVRAHYLGMAARFGHMGAQLDLSSMLESRGDRAGSHFWSGIVSDCFAFDNRRGTSDDAPIPNRKEMARAINKELKKAQEFKDEPFEPVHGIFVSSGTPAFADEADSRVIILHRSDIDAVKHAVNRLTRHVATIPADNLHGRRILKSESGSEFDLDDVMDAYGDEKDSLQIGAHILWCDISGDEIAVAMDSDISESYVLGHVVRAGLYETGDTKKRSI